jgi:hypothetical protein
LEKVTIAITPELMMAILSMDAYDRDYFAWIEDGTLGRDGLPDGLGKAALPAAFMKGTP